MLFLLVALIAVQFPVHAGSAPIVLVKSDYVLNRYGYAVVNQTVTYSNNSTSSLTPPSIQIGFGNLSSTVVGVFLAGAGFNLTAGGSPGGPFTVVSSEPLAAGGNASFTLSALLNGVVSTAKNGSLQVLTLSRPSLSLQVQSLLETVTMPASTALTSVPVGLSPGPAGSNSYSSKLNNVPPSGEETSLRAVRKSTVADFHPLEVYRAQRTITVGVGAGPVVTDSITFKNLGTTSLSTLYVSPLTSPNAQVTIVPATEPRLLNPAKVTMSNYAIDLRNSAVGFPVAAGSNYTIEYQYPLDHQYYAVAGSQVTLSLPERPPIPATVGTYAIGISVPTGVSVTQGPPAPLTSVTPWHGLDEHGKAMGAIVIAYSVGLGWAIDSGVPAASAIFVLLFIGLFVSRTTLTEEEEAEEETSTERASAMVKVFDEKTSLINGLWAEIESKDPNELSRDYFEELRGRLDAFRSRALQRLNEVRQKSTTQKFFDLLNQIHGTEREVDRAAKDKLNLYEQYYMKRMRKDVFDRLLPQYSKRLEKGLNQLSDELHVVQREAKLL